MNYALSYLFVLIWIAYMLASGVLLFSRGFLLSRVSKTDVSSCQRLSLNESDEYYINQDMVQEIFKDVNATSNLCLPQKSKVIILVIDALKYDFGVYKENITNPLPYENKLTIMYDLLQSSPNNARLLRFKADPPTTTLQRLKGLTTGSLPTFVDMGSNFASPEINEDNIIDQLVKHNRPIVFMGDSTWTDLYPRRFKRSYAYPSFDIFDLDTVDNKIKKYLPKELSKDDWEVLIAHFLGVDHCGHKHGPLHEEMARKLDEMNEVIKSVVAKMDSDTTLLVMGDHGMTASGDHGGESEDETNALLFAYTKANTFIGNEFGSDNTTMQQIDLVPTLATILGVPIPYSNLGLINFNIVPDVHVPYMRKFETLLLHAWQNAQQIYKYFFSYALENKRTFSVDDLENMHNEYILFTHRVKTVYNEAGFKSFIGDLNANMRLILSTCREIWIKFDAEQMSHGLLFTILPIFFSFLLINNLQPLEYHRIFTPKTIMYTYLFNIAAGFFGYRYYHSFSFKSNEHGAIFFTNIISSIILVYHIFENWRKIANNWSSVERFVNMPTRIIFTISVSVYFSNSFVIQEPKILSYLLVGSILLLAYEVHQKCIRVELNKRFKWSHFLNSTTVRLLFFSILAITLVRYTYTLFRCREEQGNCADFSSNAGGFSLKQPASGKTYVLAVVMIVLYTTLTRLYLRHSGSLTGGSPNVWLARYGPTIASICAGGHLLLANSAAKNVKRIHIDAMALVIYGLMLTQIIVICISPMLTFFVLPNYTMPIKISQWENVVPQIFKKIKRMYDDAEARQNQMDAMIYGLTNVYSSSTIVFGTFLSMVLIVLLEPRATIGMIACVAIAVIIILIHSILRYRTALNLENCIQPTFTAIVCWFLLAHFCFYATSHQTTLSQIDWKAAFVGRTSGLGNSHLISGVLVILNTFCGQLFFFSMYNLLSLLTFALFALYPKLIEGSHKPITNGNGALSSAPSSEGIGVDMVRGEFLLYENEGTFLGSSFKLAIQFLMLQGIKVFCAMLACTIHCRHLMVWKIFAPRFIYEGIGTFVCLAALIIGYSIVLRVNRALEGLIYKTNNLKLD